MTKGEAAALLGVSETITLAELRKRYEVLHTDFQIRLTNAPTPALKKTYQEKLQELERAAETLQPGFSASGGTADLPASEPMIAVQPHEARPVSPPRPRPGVAETATTARTEAGTGGLPRTTMIAGTAAVVLAAALSFVALRWMQASGDLTALQTEHEALTRAATALKGNAEAQERLMFSERLRVRNLSANVVKLTAVAFVYRDQAGALKVAHSGNFGYPTWEIQPGSVAQLDAELGRARLWDGPVLFYSFLVDYPGVEPFLKAGIWAHDVDRLDKVVTLDLD